MNKEPHEDCKYQEKIVEMSTDIKWLVRDSKARNHKFETHIIESDKFRTMVTRNTVWRHVFKGVAGGLAWAAGKVLNWW